MKIWSHTGSGKPGGSAPHRGVVMTGSDGEDGPKAFYIRIEALPGKVAEVLTMLRDILACFEGEPATGPWHRARYSETTFGVSTPSPILLAGRPLPTCATASRRH